MVATATIAHTDHKVAKQSKCMDLFSQVKGPSKLRHRAPPRADPKSDRVVPPNF